MRLSRWQTAGAVTCLATGPLGQLAQFLVSPMKEADSPAVQVAAAVAHPQSMHAATVLDVLLLLLLPAVLYAGRVAGSAQSKLAMAATAVTFVSVLGAGYLLAQDVVVSAAAAQPDPHAAVALPLDSSKWTADRLEPALARKFSGRQTSFNVKLARP